MSAPSPARVELWDTALHEAGHAVAAIAGGWRVTHLSIVPYDVPGGQFLGSIQTAGRPMNDELGTCDRQTCERYFAYRFAGPVAATIFSASPQDFNAVALDHELHQPGTAILPLLLQRHAPGTLDDYIRALWAATVAVLRPRRGRVEMLARTLLRERQMDRQAIQRIIGACLLFGK